MAALLHDFDYEIHPTLDKHPQDGAPILREEGYPEIVSRRCSRTPSTSALPRDTPLKKALFACDELSGFVHACALVRPTGLEALEPKSVRKKLKQPSFAAGVSPRRRLRGRRAARASTSTSTSRTCRRAAADRRRARPAELSGLALREPLGEPLEVARRRSTSRRTRAGGPVPGSSRTITPRS